MIIMICGVGFTALEHGSWQRTCPEEGEHGFHSSLVSRAELLKQKASNRVLTAEGQGQRRRLDGQHLGMSV